MKAQSSLHHRTTRFSKNVKEQNAIITKKKKSKIQLTDTINHPRYRDVSKPILEHQSPYE